jgi:hypothetical protein
MWPVFVAEVTLSAGVHTVKGIGIELSGGSYIVGTGTAIVGDTRVSLSLVSGSGAGGVLTDVQENATDVAVTSTPVVITTHTVTVADETVFLTVSFPYTPASTSTLKLQYRIDSGSWVEFARHGENAGYATGMDGQVALALTPGTYTIEVGASSTVGTTTILGTNWPARSVIWQYRGGLIPIRADGTTLTDKPAALNFVGHGAYLSGDAVNVEMNQAVAAPGTAIAIFEEQFLSTQTLVSGTYADIPGSALPEQTFQVPYPGYYDLQILLSALSPSTAGQAETHYQAIFDESDYNGFPEQILGSPASMVDEWVVFTENSGTTSWEYKTLSGEIWLDVGEHKVKFQAKVDLGSPRVAVNGTMKIKGILRSGSGVGGLLVEEKTGAYTGSNPTYTAASWTDVQDQSGGSPMEVSIDTSEGDDVIINFIGYAWNPSGTNWIDLRVLKDGTDVVYNVRHRFGVSSEDSDLPFTVVDKDAAAGTHTYKLQVWVNGGITVGFNTTSSSYPFVLTAAIARGGLVPIRQDGATVIDKPAAINVVGPNATVTNTGGTANLQFNGVTGEVETQPYFAGLTGGVATPTTGGAGSFTLGNRFSVTEEGCKIGGGFFYTAQSGAHTIRVSLWEAGNATALKTVDVSCSGPGFYEGRFADAYEVADADVPDKLFYISFWETSGSTWTEWTSTVYFDQTYVHRFYSSTNRSKYYAAGDANPEANTAPSSSYPVDPLIIAPGDEAGFVQPENVPVLQYATAANIDLVPGPGADARLWLKLNDGMRYYADTLSVDLTVSGLGGLDTGSEAASTFYTIYAVKDTATGKFNVVASVTGPATGPTGYDVWRYLGKIYNNASSDIRQFKQIGDFFEFPDPTETALKIYEDGGSEQSPTLATWVSFTSGSAPGGGTQRPLTSAIPVDVAGAVDLSAVVDTDTGDEIRLFLESGQVQYTPTVDQTTAQAFVEAEASQRSVNRGLIALHANDAYYRWESSGHAGLNFRVIVRGYTDKYLGTNAEARVPAPYAPDTKSPKGTWATTSTVSFDARPGQSSTTRLTLQDGTQRTMTTGTFDIANGVADWGYDEAASQGNSKLLYFYAVPKSGDDTQVVVRVSDNVPGTGPTGYTNFKLVWATYIDGSGNLLGVRQSGNRFVYHEKQPEVTGTSFDGSPVQRTLTYCPASAGYADLTARMQPNGNGYGEYRIWIDDGGAPTDSAATTVTTVYYSFNVSGHNQERGLIPLVTSRSIYYRRFQGSGTLQSTELSMHGWVDEWIDP